MSQVGGIYGDVGARATRAVISDAKPIRTKTSVTVIIKSAEEPFFRARQALVREASGLGEGGRAAGAQASIPRDWEPRTEGEITMAEMFHGLVSGLIWAAILGSCLIAIATVITATALARETVPASDTAAGTTHAPGVSPIPRTARPAPPRSSIQNGGWGWSPGGSSTPKAPGTSRHHKDKDKGKGPFAGCRGRSPARPPSPAPSVGFDLWQAPLAQPIRFRAERFTLSRQAADLIPQAR
jgi:hypothetical protein